MKKAMAWGLSILMLIVMVPSALAYPAAGTYGESIDSDFVPISAYGIDYEMWSTMYQDASNTWRGSSWVHNTANTNVPAGYMGVATGLYRPDGAKYIELDMNYNRAPESFHYQITNKVSADSVGIICKGRIAVYNGAGYDTVDAPSTVVRYPSRSAMPVSEYIASVVDMLAVTLDENNEYPVTAAGKTYGSELLYDLVGERPDLIYAEGIGGTKGYILSSDLEPDVSDPEEAVAYTNDQRSNADGYYIIPLYDLNENVIGSFKVSIADDKVPPEIQETARNILETDEKARIIKLLGTDSYSVNSQGETYGSSLLARVVGAGPDLSAAIGTEGQDGYIRERDTVWGQWKDSIRTPQDALRYMEYTDTLPDEYLIPLYDHEGNVIGEFRYCLRASDGGLSGEEVAAQIEAR